MIERSLDLDIELANIYRRKILWMLDTFVSLMYCSHLSIKPTKFMLGEKDKSEETRYNQSKTTHKTFFRCWDSNHIWVKMRNENARNFCNYFEPPPFFLFKMKPHKKKVICFMPYICNMLTKCSLGPLPTQFDRSLISKLFQMMPFRLHCSWIISKTHTATLELGSSFWLIP